MLKNIRKTLKTIPLVESFLKTDTWSNIKYKFLLQTTERVNVSCTRFLRGPMQLEALVGPVLDILPPEVKEK